MNYICQKCGYGQDFEPTAENLQIHFPELKEPCEDYECPAYKQGEFIPCKGQLIQE